MAEIAVTNSEANGRYEARVGGKLAGILEYQPNRAGALILVHTEVLPEFEGHGVAGEIVRFALADIRARGLKAQVVCPYVSGYVERHPDEVVGILA